MTKAAPRALKKSIETVLGDPPTVLGADGDPDAAPGREVQDWKRRYIAALVLVDTGCAVLGIGIGWAARLGVPHDTPYFRSYSWISIAVIAGWILCLQQVRAYDLRSVGTGTQDVRLLLRAALILAGSVAIVAYLTQVLVARTFVAIAIPIGVLLQIIVRYIVRRLVYTRRARGEWTRTILAVGTTDSVQHLIDATRRNTLAGLRVVGVCVQDTELGAEVAPGVPVVGQVTEAARAAAAVGADIVAVTGSGLGPGAIRELGWQLEGSGRNMVMAPGLTGVAGPRVHVSPVEGLPLVWVDQPQFTGLGRVAKRGMDVVGSTVLIVLSSPLLLALGALVRLTSPGAALYRSVRTGMDGRLINVYKFRSMYTDAEDRKNGLLELNESEGGVLFKMRDDPRITRVGKFLRKFSFDELPQLFNVFGGSMSLVGPRPPLPDEVERYHDHVRRRMLVKPGMTGLWQVSGRSDLAWDEAVRLDLFYVENWSLSLDIAIIMRTVWAVLRGRGAY